MHTLVDRAITRRRRLVLLLVHLVLLLLIAGAFLFRFVIDRLPATDPNGARLSGCLLHDVLHIYCPLCGGTRALVALLQGRLSASLQYNPVTAYLAAGFVALDAVALTRILHRSPAPLIRIPKWYWIGAIVLAVLVFIVRNALMIFYGIDNLDGLALYW